MSDRARWVTAGALKMMVVTAIILLVDKDWRYAAWLAVGFVSGAVWWACVARDWGAG